MPDLIPPGADDSAELAAANAAAEASLAASRKGPVSDRPEINPAAASALDEAFASLKDSADEPITEENIGRQNAGVKPPVSGEPAKEPVKPEPGKEPSKPEPAKEPAKEPKKPEPAKPEPKKRTGLVDDLLDDEPSKPKDKDPKDAYDDVKLRSDASEKTVSSFEAVKARAIERETAVRTELEGERAKRLELENRITELEKSAGKLTPEIEAELKEHREYRALHDVTSRPEFKEKFDSKVEANYNEVYKLFEQEGMSVKNLEALRAMPENERLDFIEKNVLERLTSGQKRVVEAKLFENVNIAAEKAKAVAAARTDAERILAEQKELPQRERAARDKAFADVLRPMLQKLPYVYPKEVPSTATPAEKTALEAHNARALEMQEVIKQAISDDSPATRAQAILAVPMARFYAAQNRELQQRLEAAEGKLAAIQKAGSTSRLGKAAAAPIEPAAPKRGSDQDGDHEIDQLFKQHSAALVQ